VEQQKHPLVPYCSRLVSGLVVCAVVAVTLHADVAAVAMLTAVSLVVLAVTSVILRHGER
jgi:hypothetical protein